eukprot:CAMPEP_0180309292 /NCGR_PEP_ID=MMETSP0988-20121125/29014_1 /TAXON_ID=697907 /ORGANISM="non described non described, Strain CCMP2293" /LENGTH=46 /DNA_ID= /DNA_START= /DNA_END= /DNA_ORIENTATION=
MSALMTSRRLMRTASGVPDSILALLLILAVIKVLKTAHACLKNDGT